jgi:two-component system response regulator TtrR
MQRRTAETGSATVYIVDDDAGFRASLAWLVESHGKAFEVYSSAEQFLEMYDPNRLGCLVLDFRLPGMSGIALLETMKARGSCLPAIVLTAHADTPLAVYALKLGAFDFIEKPFDHSLPDRISSAIEFHARELRMQQLRAAQRKRLASLTKREREVMDLVVQGQANKVIAFDLGLSEKTVEVHRSRVMRKLNARSLAELVRFNVTATGMQSAPRPLLACEAHQVESDACAA